MEADKRRRRSKKKYGFEGEIFIKKNCNKNDIFIFLAVNLYLSMYKNDRGAKKKEVQQRELKFVSANTFLM